MQLLKDYLGKEGELSRLIPDFVSRPVQIQMARAVADAVSEGKNALLEAGTGTGKTYAYLIPLIDSGKKVIISTGTKNLQDQLFFQDLPLITGLVNGGYRTALLKGRGNYVCPERLDKSLKVISGNSASGILDRLVGVREWMSRTHTGDITELSDFSNDAGFASMITSTRDNCLGTSCPRIGECPLYRARNAANEADLIVVNHHLLFADIALREENMAQLLPRVETIVVDEAHQVPEVARQFFGDRIGSGQILELARDIKRELFLLGNDDRELLASTEQLERALGNMNALVSSPNEIGDLSGWLENQGEASVEGIDLALGDLMQGLEVAAIRSQGLHHCLQRVNRLADQFALLTEPVPLDQAHVHWIQIYTQGFVIHVSPVSIATELSVHFSEPVPNWIFTSATLSVGGNFDHIRESLGLEDVTENLFVSPFEYEAQVLSYVPEGLPQPGTDMHTRTLVEILLPFFRAGKTFCLFTSHRALNLAGELLAMEDDLFVLSQGQLSKTELLERFRRTPDCILLATQSFWEGVDLRGAGLKCLIIDKIPFGNPDDPIARAMMNSIESSGGNGFMEYLLPQAIISLKQGFGRLIRQESDAGLFVLGDPRVMVKSYGRLVLTSLPTMNWTMDQSHALEHLRSLTKKEQGSSHESVGN
jgi:ATP-dependent DNA helicase DinG|tara:strand:+ start:34048 stop:36000 length:1953 start_codon:yes stop_codon:yes gene_type:complete